MIRNGIYERLQIANFFTLNYILPRFCKSLLQKVLRSFFIRQFIPKTPEKRLAQMIICLKKFRFFIIYIFHNCRRSNSLFLTCLAARLLPKGGQVAPLRTKAEKLLQMFRAIF